MAEVAGAVCFLASRDAAFVNASDLKVWSDEHSEYSVIFCPKTESKKCRLTVDMEQWVLRAMERAVDHGLAATNDNRCPTLQQTDVQLCKKHMSVWQYNFSFIMVNVHVNQSHWKIEQ